MKAIKVKLNSGIAQLNTEIRGRRQSFTGAWNLIIEDDQERTFSIQCLVPGSPDSLSGLSGAMGDWSKNDYAIELSAYDEKGDDFSVNEETAKELKSVLQQMESGEIKPVNVYGGEVSSDYVMKVVEFIKPKLEYVPRNIEGGTIATRMDIETSMSQNDLPPISRA